MPVTEHKNSTIDMPGAVETLKKLKSKGHKLYIVSFCGKARAIGGKEEVAKKGLDDVFTEQIYINNPYEKGTVLKNYGCNFMVDDRIDLLNFIRKKNPYVKTILFGQKNDKCIGTEHICAETWDNVYKIINSSPAFNSPIIKSDFTKWLSIKPKKNEPVKEPIKEE